MTDDTAGAGLDRFGQLKAEIVATHGVEASDPVVNTIAALRLARERMVESLPAGRHVDFTAFTRVLEMLEKHEPGIVPKITVTFVKGTIQTGSCGVIRHFMASRLRAVSALSQAR